MSNQPPDPWVDASPLRSGNDTLAETAARQIAAIGAPAIPNLLKLTEPENDPDTRWWAVRALSGINAPEIGSHLASFLRDPDPALRECATLGLSQHPTESAIPELIACLSGPNRLLARLAGNALASIGSPAVPALIAIMEKGGRETRPYEPAARLEAAKALATIGDQRAIPVFLKAIQDGDTSLIEYWADFGLDQMGVGMAFFEP